MSLAPSPLLDFSPWSFLTTPLDNLLAALDARVDEVPIEGGRILGGIIRRDWGLQVVTPQQGNPVEKDLAVRGVLAHWFGVDTSAWPLEMQFTDLDAAPDHA